MLSHTSADNREVSPKSLEALVLCSEEWWHLPTDLPVAIGPQRSLLRRTIAPHGLRSGGSCSFYAAPGAQGEGCHMSHRALPASPEAALSWEQVRLSSLLLPDQQISLYQGKSICGQNILSMSCVHPAIAIEHSLYVRLLSV